MAGRARCLDAVQAQAQVRVRAECELLEHVAGRPRERAVAHADERAGAVAHAHELEPVGRESSTAAGVLVGVAGHGDRHVRRSGRVDEHALGVGALRPGCQVLVVAQAGLTVAVEHRHEPALVARLESEGKYRLEVGALAQVARHVAADPHIQPRAARHAYVDPVAAVGVMDAIAGDGDFPSPLGGVEHDPGPAVVQPVADRHPDSRHRRRDVEGRNVKAGRARAVMARDVVADDLRAGRVEPIDAAAHCPRDHEVAHDRAAGQSHGVAVEPRRIRVREPRRAVACLGGHGGAGPDQALTPLEPDTPVERTRLPPRPLNDDAIAGPRARLHPRQRVQRTLAGTTPAVLRAGLDVPRPLRMG